MRNAIPANLRGLVLLAGSVRPRPLTTLIGRAVCHLPLEPHCSVVEDWYRQARQVAALAPSGRLSVHVMVDRGNTQWVDTTPATDDAAPVYIMRDPVEYRGTGGVLHDLARQFEDDDLLLVANAAQVLTESLAELAVRLAETQGDIAIISHGNGVPSGLSLVRCGALRDLPPEGFVDFKEQALPAISATHRVTVLELEQPSGLPVRTLKEYIDALRHHHQTQAGREHQPDPYAEDWDSAFSIVEDGATVNASARIHESVVLKGGRVEADAVVVRSIVCPGGVVRRGTMSVEELASPRGDGRKVT